MRGRPGRWVYTQEVNMGLIDILAAWKNVRTDISNKEYLQAWEDTLPAQKGMIDFGRQLGFKADPSEAATADEITVTIQGCVDDLKADKTKAAAGSLDWKSILATILQAILAAWLNKP